MVDGNGFEFKPSIRWSCKYSPKLHEIIEENLSDLELELDLDKFRKVIGIALSYTPRHISSNIILKVRKDLSNVNESFDIIGVKNSQNELQSYRLVWK